MPRIIPRSSGYRRCPVETGCTSEEKIRIVLDGLRGEHSVAELCRREGIAESLYYTWSKEFLEAGKRRLAGDIARAATSGEVKDLRREWHLRKRLHLLAGAGFVARQSYAGDVLKTCGVSR